jgi:hypothetical protein
MAGGFMDTADNSRLEIVPRNRIRVLVYGDVGEIVAHPASNLSISEELRLINREVRDAIGQSQLEELIANPNRIPENLRQYILLSSCGMMYGPFASRFIPCLYWRVRDASWHLGFLWLDAGGRDRLIGC